MVKVYKAQKFDVSSGATVGRVGTLHWLTKIRAEIDVSSEREVPAEEVDEDGRWIGKKQRE